MVLLVVGLCPHLPSFLLHIAEPIDKKEVVRTAKWIALTELHWILFCSPNLTHEGTANPAVHGSEKLAEKQW